MQLPVVAVVHLQHATHAGDHWLWVLVHCVNFLSRLTGVQLPGDEARVRHIR